MKLLLALISLASAAVAQPTALTLDPVQTKVEYVVGSLLHTVHGTFALKHGEIRFDPAGGAASGAIVVDAASGNSESSGRDKRMTKEILEAPKYPEIAFRPDRIDGAVASSGTSKVQIHGVFSIHGADHELTAPAEVEASGGQYKATVHFTVPYIQWGMKNPSTLFLKVDDKVQITLIAVAKPVS